MRGTWMKNTVLLLGMSLAGTALLAQQTTPEAAPPATSQAVTQGSTATSGALQLTVEQKKQMRELRLSARDQAAIIRHDQSLTDDQKTAKLKALRASTREQMKAVLTPAQQAAFADAARRTSGEVCRKARPDARSTEQIEGTVCLQPAAARGRADQRFADQRPEDGAAQRDSRDQQGTAGDHSDAGTVGAVPADAPGTPSLPYGNARSKLNRER